MAEAATQTSDEKPASNPRAVTGTVTSNKMDKSITVLVERRVKHPVYGKYVKRSKKLHAHDEDNACNIGEQHNIGFTRLPKHTFFQRYTRRLPSLFFIHLCL